MKDVLTLARQFRAELLANDADAQAAVLRAYDALWQGLNAEIERVVTQIQAKGSSPSLLFQRQRLEQLQHELADEINRVAGTASEITLRNQARVVEWARSHSLQMMESAGRTARLRFNFSNLATDEIRHLIGIARDGSPVRNIFNEIARSLSIESGEAIKNALIEGMALGSNPRRIAAAVRKQVDGGPDRELNPRTVTRLNAAVRQEVLGAYREATRLSYQDNAKVLAGWIWTATRSATTCIICWAMDGTVFPADAPLISHVNCRCVMRPLLPGQSPGETGADAFAKLARGVQKDILGDLAFAAYEDGLLELKDFVGIMSSERWGDSRFRRGLDDIIGKSTVHKLRLKQ
jgi:hypothetical protein